MNLILSDKTAWWVMDWYAHNRNVPAEVPSFSDAFFIESANYLKEKNITYLYRGFGEFHKKQLQKDFTKYKNLLKKIPSSWTYDENVAQVFAFGYSDDGVVIALPLKKFKRYIVFDLLVKAITVEQINTNPDNFSKELFKKYKSEYEVLVFEHISVTPKDISEPENLDYLRDEGLLDYDMPF